MPQADTCPAPALPSFPADLGVSRHVGMCWSRPLPGSQHNFLCGSTCFWKNLALSTVHHLLWTSVGAESGQGTNEQTPNCVMFHSGCRALSPPPRLPLLSAVLTVPPYSAPGGIRQDKAFPALGATWHVDQRGRLLHVTAHTHERLPVWRQPGQAWLGWGLGPMEAAGGGRGGCLTLRGAAAGEDVDEV